MKLYPSCLADGLALLVRGEDDLRAEASGRMVAEVLIHLHRALTVPR